MRYEEQIVVMRAVEIRRALDRIASEILEKNTDIQNVYLVGIRTGGAHLAERLRRRLTKSEGEVPGFGIVDIGLYRDDVFSGSDSSLPVVGTTEIHDDLTGKDVVLVDDVIFTGRTIRAAMDAVIDFGRPGRIELAVLIDRGLREFPIHPDSVGRIIPTNRDERVVVELTEEGFEEDCVLITPKAGHNDSEEPMLAAHGQIETEVPPEPKPAKKAKKSSAKAKTATKKSTQSSKATSSKTKKTTQKTGAKPARKSTKKPAKAVN